MEHAPCHGSSREKLAMHELGMGRARTDVQGAHDGAQMMRQVSVVRPVVSNDSLRPGWQITMDPMLFVFSTGPAGHSEVPPRFSSPRIA